MMFTHAAFLVAAQIAVLASAGGHTAAPTSAPTSVPTSVPTSAPTSSPGAGGLGMMLEQMGLNPCIGRCEALQEAMAQRRLRGHESAGGTPDLPDGVTPCSIAQTCLNEPRVEEACLAAMGQTAMDALESSLCSTGEASATETVTSFTVSLNVASASDFDETDYLASIAATTGSDAANVVVKSVTYVVSASYSFAEDITEADIKTAMATNAGVPESQVTVTVTTVRRLRSGEGRRLAITADVSISTTDADTADSAKTAAADATAFATQLTTVTGSTVAAPTVTTAPAMAVVVETEVVSTTGTAVTAPTAAALATDLSTRTGVTITAEVTNVATTSRAAPTSAPAPAAPAPAAPAPAASSQTSSASKVLATKALLSGLLAPLFAFLLNAAF